MTRAGTQRTGSGWVRGSVRVGLVAAAIGLAGGAGAGGAGAAGAEGGGSVRVENGTTQLGACDSPDALTAGPTEAFVCLGGPKTDFGALRAAYKRGGMTAVGAEVAKQDAAAGVEGVAGVEGSDPDVNQLGGGVTVEAAAASPVQVSGLHNAKDSTTHWIYYGTVIYGTIRTDGQITQYGQFFTRDDVWLKGNYADFTYSADPTQGSTLRFKLSMWFDITTQGGYWKDSTVTCGPGAYSGNKYTCTNHYWLAGPNGYYAGLGFYAHSKAQWWNSQSPNPSSADGSWTLTIGHGPMDCKNRTQRCQWR